MHVFHVSMCLLLGSNGLSMKSQSNLMDVTDFIGGSEDALQS